MGGEGRDRGSLRVWRCPYGLVGMEGVFDWLMRALAATTLAWVHLRSVTNM